VQAVSYLADFSSSLGTVTAAALVVLQLPSFVIGSRLVESKLTLEVYTSVLGNSSVCGWYFGDFGVCKQTVLPAMLERMPDPDSTTAETQAWLTALNDIAEGGVLAEPQIGYVNHKMFYSKSFVTREAQPLTNEALTSYFQYIVDKGLTASFPWNTFISLYGEKDNQINRPAAESAAYTHRDSS
jgi:hypothetical protein